MAENPVGQRIDALLKQRGFDLATLATRTGLPYATLYNLRRRADAKLSAKNADLCAAQLGTTAQFILTGIAPPADDRRAHVLSIYDSLDETGRVEIEEFAEFLRQRRAQSAK